MILILHIKRCRTCFLQFSNSIYIIAFLFVYPKFSAVYSYPIREPQAYCLRLFCCFRRKESLCLHSTRRMRTSFIEEQQEVTAYAEKTAVKAEVSVPLDLMLLCGGTSFTLFLWGHMFLCSTCRLLNQPLRYGSSHCRRSKSAQ